METLPVHKQLLEFVDIGGDLRDRISAMGLHVIFKPLIDYYLVQDNEDHETFNKVLFYILMLYTKGSEAIHPGVSWAANKTAVAEQLDIPHSLYSELNSFKVEAVLDTIRRYLDYQISKAWYHLQMIRDLYEQMVSSAMEPVSDSGMTWDQKKKNQEYANTLYHEIVRWEQVIAEEEMQLEGKKEIKRKTKKGEHFSLRTEDILKQTQKEEGVLEL